MSTVDPIKVYFTVSESEYLAFNRRFPTNSERQAQFKREPLDLILADGTTYEHPGYVYFADREVNLSTGSIRIAGLFPNPGNILRPGGYGKVRAANRIEKGALLVPQRAVAELQGGYQVALVDSENKVHSAVEVGEHSGVQWIIQKGLKPGDRVVADGLQKVRAGMQVNPKPFVAESERDQGEVSRMSKFFINRPIVAIVVSIVMVIVGAITILSLPVAQFPNIVPPEIQVLATYVGADAQTLEQSVAAPIEQQMSGVDNANYMYSLNATATRQQR